MTGIPSSDLMIFFNIGWMTHYLGAATDDLTLGGHGHLKTSDHGAEAFNFAPVAGKYYGYRPPGEKRVNIDRLGAQPGDGEIEGVTVVWMARRPGSQDTVIVGWYTNATVHRSTQTVPSSAPARSWPEYMVEASTEDCRLLPVTARNFQILSSHRRAGGFGQSPTFYDEADLYRSDVAAYILAVDSNVAAAKRKSGRGGGRSMDPERRRLIEQTAVEHAMSYYKSDEGGGWDVVSVESLARGWDLECARGDEALYIEVKGCSGNEVQAELTPNEWAKMTDRGSRQDYVLYVVTDCLSEVPLASAFRYHPRGVWRTMDGRELQIQERMAARVSCVM